MRTRNVLVIAVLVIAIVAILLFDTFNWFHPKGESIVNLTVSDTDTVLFFTQPGHPDIPDTIKIQEELSVMYPLDDTDKHEVRNFRKYMLGLWVKLFKTNQNDQKFIRLAKKLLSKDHSKNLDDVKKFHDEVVMESFNLFIDYVNTLAAY